MPDNRDGLGEVQRGWQKRVLADWRAGRADAAIAKIVVAIAMLRRDSHPPQPIAEVVSAVLEERAALGETPQAAQPGGVGISWVVRRNEPGHADSGGSVVAEFANDDQMRNILARLAATPTASNVPAFGDWLKSYVGMQDATTMRFSVAELEIAFNAARAPVPAFGDLREAVEALILDLSDPREGSCPSWAVALMRRTAAFLRAALSPSHEVDHIGAAT